MIARRRMTKGALTSIIGAILVLSIFMLLGTFAAADVPWPHHLPEQDPYKYEDYSFSAQLPDDYSPADGDFWKYTSERDDSCYFNMSNLSNPDLYDSELEGVMGASVDKAWSITTGRPDVLIAELDSGINWQDVVAMNELARKCYLNSGELPPPQGADRWDANGDGVFNVDDYIGDPRATDLNGNGLLDPQDLIWFFSDGEDDDANGYIDDISGWDFLEDDNDPWDEVEQGHGTAECVWSAGEADNGSGMPGTCPNAMLLVVRVGDSLVVDVNDFAQGVVFAVDSGAWVVQAASSGFNHTPLGQSAIDYAYFKGVAVIASGARGESARQSFPGAYERTIQVNAVQKSDEMDSALRDEFPPSYLYLGGNTGYGAHTIVSTPSDGHSSGAVGRLAGITGLLYSAAENEVQRGEMWRYPGTDKPLSACEVKQLIAMTADDVDFAPGYYGVSFGLLDTIIGPSQRFRSDAGWDPYFGYGRVNAYKAVRAVDEGRIPPEAEIREPQWFELLNPGQVSLEIKGRVAAVRADSFQYTVEWGPGWNPREDEWVTALEADYQYETVEGVLATLDLGEVYGAVLDTMGNRGGSSDPNRYAFTIRVRVRDELGNWGEDRKSLFCFDDPDAYPGSPVRMGSDLSASPRFADLDSDGEDELIAATGEGLIHAYNPDFSEVAGWPVHVTPLPLHEGSEGFTSGMVSKTAYGSVIATPALGDLDHDGTLEVVAGDTQGRVYAWDSSGRLLPGFPVRSNPLYSIPDRADWWTEGTLPAEWHASRFVPDRVHRLDAWNRLDNAFLGAPVLCNLDGSTDGTLEIVTACLDRHLYAWHADGRAVGGWPVKLVDPEKVAEFDQLTHTCKFNDAEAVIKGSKVVGNPSVADLDGDGDLEVVCGTNEVYTAETLNVSSQTFGFNSFLSFLKPLLGGSAGHLSDPGNARAYALHHDGFAHGLEPGVQPPADAVPSQAYLGGWPARLAVAAPGMLSDMMEDAGGPAAIADIDGDGKMEIGISSASGPAYLLEMDGTSFFGADEAGLPLSLRSNEAGPGAESADVPVMSAPGGGCFATLGENGLSYVAPTMGLGRVIDTFLPASQTGSDDQLSAWSVSDGRLLAPFPRKVNDMTLTMTPGAADIDGDGMQEVLAGSSYYDFHAVNAAGVEPAGWPKFTGGWSVGTPAVGDLDADGSREVVIGTREGWLLIWQTPSSVSDLADWPQYKHDSWGTGCLDSDASRPGRVMDLAAEKMMKREEPKGVKLTWTAPGDDGYQGQALCYEIRFLNRPIDEESWRDAIPLERDKPMPAGVGSLQEYIVEGVPFASPKDGTTFYFALQSRDEAGNFSVISNLTSISYGEEVEPQEEPAEPEPVETEPAEPEPGSEETQPEAARVEAIQAAQVEPAQVTYRWYFAEGSTGFDESGSFETWILLQNPGEDTATVTLTYMTPQGEVHGPALELAPGTRDSVNVAATVPGNWQVSTVVESNREIAAERAMYWNAPGDNRRAATASIGVPAPTTRWYFAEGSTGFDASGSFETWILVQNPGDDTANVTLTYITPQGEVTGPALVLAPGTRESVNVAATVPGNWQVSTRVESDRPVVAERAMYWNAPGAYRQAATVSIGVAAPSTRWYFAEGSTGGDESGSFETWILLQNPTEWTGEVTVTYMTPEGEVEGPVIELPPGTRRSVNVADTVPGNWQVSARVVCEPSALVAERAVYWNAPGAYRQSATVSVGVREPDWDWRQWYFAEGSTGGDASGSFETWILVQNPLSPSTTVTLTYLTSEGEVPGPVLEVAPGTRESVNVADTVPGNWEVSTKVESSAPVVVERAVYWNAAGPAPGACRRAATDSIAAAA